MHCTVDAATHGIASWRVACQDSDFRTLAKILQAAKGAGELAHLRQEMAKLEMAEETGEEAA